MYCTASHCMRKATCIHHNKLGKHETVDWSMMGSGKCDANGNCEVIAYCGDDSITYPKYKSIDPANCCFDAHGKLVKDGDVIRFDNGHRFKLVIKNSKYCLESLDIDLPLLVVDKVCMNNTFYSGTKEE